MTEVTARSVEHATFSLERTYAASKARVFAALANKDQKAKWFGDPSSPPEQWDFDFREGGREYESSEFEGARHTFDAVYLDIVEDERVVWSYNLYVNGVKLSSSMTVVELTALEGGTRLTFTETGAFFDGHEKPELREQGTGWLLDALGKSLE
ncbi:MAG TPA: SRPBCC domain-containing protein [Galbitalea sp.]|jgi:uncharacterized protein YndB with AHSA1/START domain|nr:SRPBCC domain-containing protein [Galbitalea sp.]